MIVNAQTMYINQKSFGTKIGEDMLNTFIASGVIPEGMLDNNNKDMYDDRLFVKISNKKQIVSNLYLHYSLFMPVDKTSVECCVKLYELGKYYYNSLWLVAIENDFSYTICGKAALESWIEDQKCQPYDFIKAKQHCKKCKKQNCTMLFIMDDSAF